MRKIIQFIKSIKIKQVLTVFMAGCLLLISTACSKDNVAQAERGVQPTAKSSMSKSGMSDTNDTYNKYDANQEYKGGMNGYNDDQRYDYDAGAAAKAKTLVDTAKRSQVDNLGDDVDNVTDRAKSTVKEAQRETPRNLKNNTENAVDYVQDKSDKLQRNLSKVPGGAKDVFDEATSPIQDTLNDANKVTKKAAQEIKGNDDLGDDVDNVTDRAKSTVKEAQRETPRNLKNNTENAVDYVQDKSDKLQRNLSKVPGGAKDVFDEATSPIQDTLNDANKVTKKAAQEIKGNFEDLS